ncbi:hypothetical protein GCM10023311_22910 [Flaviramulus aquimarinus]|uniref:Uncharacterized protein n=2 Tax=Flaviramulus aquimarinus TaxID=1170456 RepID=A0ABP9F9X0_9FLAO
MMEEHKTDRDILAKGLKIMGMSLGCMFLGPTLVYIALTNQEKPLYIPILILAILLCGLAIFLAFKGINTVMDSMFKKK